MAHRLIVQISDIHLTAGGTLALAGQEDARPRENLVAALERLRRSEVRPDLLLLSGDLANEGNEGCYQDLADLVGDLARATGAAVLYLPGNHDQRGAFARVLLGGGDGDGPLNQVLWLGGLRVLALDSTVPGQVGGMLDEETLGWLRHQLAEPASEGTLLALHHPPILSPIQQMAGIALANPQRLAEVVAGSDVRLIVCGHNHHAQAGTLAGIGVWVSPAVAYLADTSITGAFRGMPGWALSRVDVDAGSATASALAWP